MRSLRFRVAALAALICLPIVFAHAATVHGTVKNGTTGKAAAGIDVILIQLQGGMQPVANTKTNAQGEFSFDNSSAGAQPMLIRAVFHGVNFHQPLIPGKSDVQIEVFEPTQDPKTINVSSHVIIFQPNGSLLTVAEEYSVDNRSQPPQAFYRANGNFEFALPEKTQLQQAAAWGPSGMPVVQATIDKPNNHYAVAFAFRPGESGVRYSYEVPYPGNSTTIKLPTVYPSARLIVVAPPSMQITGDGLQARGQEQGMSIYGRDDVPANEALAVNVSGTAPPLAAASNEDPNSRNDANQTAATDTVANVQAIPGRLDVLKWPLVAGFLGIFALGAIFLARRPVPVAPVGVAMDANQVQSARVAQSNAASLAAMASTSSVASIAAVDAAVGVSLDTLKDQIFRLELRRQAGTISEEEYAQQRAQAEKVLRELLRG
ncbi:MAG TPA: hypothetical protein VGI16_06610 [Candidatus Acidoferrum sp.]|jgi:hypothetical protein